MNEVELIDWMRDRAGRHPDVMIGIGDDAAVLNPTGEPIVVATDMFLEGRHFRLAECGPEAIGRKSLGANLSDLAAMAARPISAFVAFALPNERAIEIAQGITHGITGMAVEYGLTIAGGDTNTWDGPLVVCLTVLGRPGPAGTIGRAGARPGDLIAVTGPLGGSILGRHLDPVPRINEALLLAELGPPSAQIDLSDGLATDLGHILRQSGGWGATIDEAELPIHPDAHRLAEQDRRPAIEHALADGEDFELCVVLTPERAEAIREHRERPDLLMTIGTIDAEPGLRLRAADGTIRSFEHLGFDHLSRPRRDAP